MSPSSTTKALNDHFAEVIFSTNEMLIAQCYKESLSGKPSKSTVSQGSIVKVISSYDDSYVAFGLIAKINNSSLDNIHRPSALGMTSKELEHLQPQVFDLLRKEVEIYLFAYKEEGKVYNYPPSKPMMIHDFVSKATNDEVLQLTEDISSLINLVKRNQLKPDILSNLINLAYILRRNDYNYLVKMGQELSLAFADEFDFLIQILKRLSKST